MQKRKVHIRKKGRVYEFYDKGKVDVMHFWEQRKSFSTQKVGRKMIFLYYLRNLHSLRNEEGDASDLHKGHIFFNMEYHVY